MNLKKTILLTSVIIVIILLVVVAKKVEKERELNRRAEELRGAVEVLCSNSADRVLAFEDNEELLRRASEGTVLQVLVNGLSPVELAEASNDRDMQEKVWVLMNWDDVFRHANDKVMYFVHKEYSDANYIVYSFDSWEILTDSKLQDDLISIERADYDTLFVSMYDISGYKPEITYEGTLWECCFAGRPAASSERLKYLMEGAFCRRDDLGASIERVILGVDPLKMLSDSQWNEQLCKETYYKQIRELVDSNPKIEFMLLFPGYHGAHYAREDADRIVRAYEKFLDSLSGESNVTYHFFGNQEWILKNPNVFEDGSDIRHKPSVADVLQRQAITDRIYQLSEEELLEEVAEVADGIREYYASPMEHPDLSDTCVVILGDSIFGLYNDETSIQEVIRYYTGAHVINYAIGGASASSRIGNDGSIMGGELDDPEQLRKDIEATNCSKLLFVIEFGLNDYISGVPLYSDKDSYSITTFYGAMTKGLETVMTNWEKAQILVLVPGWIDYGHHGRRSFGKDYDPELTLQAYRDVCIRVAQEANVDYLDLSLEAGINEDNVKRYLYADMIHYDQEGRFAIAKSILKWSMNNYITQ